MKLKEVQKETGKRFIIIDEATGKVIDDANGYGFKTKKAAHRCYSYKYEGGKERKDKLVAEAKQLLKTCERMGLLETVQKLYDDLEYEYFRNFKDFNFDGNLIDEENRDAFNNYVQEFRKLLGKPIDRKLIRTFNDLLNKQ